MRERAEMMDGTLDIETSDARNPRARQRAASQRLAGRRSRAPARPAPGCRSGTPSRPAARGPRARRSPAGSRSRRACSLASRQPPRWPQPCGSATVPGVISSVTLTRHVDRAGLRLEPRLAAVLETVRRGVVGMDAQRMLAAAAHQQRRVVHPRVVGAQLAQADQPQREARVVAVGRRQPRELGRDRRRREPHALVAVAQLARAARRWRRGRPSTMPVRVLVAQLAQASPPRRRPKQVALGPVRSSRSSSCCGVEAHARRRASARSAPDAVRERCRAAARDLVDDLPLLARLARRRDDRRR